jgi:pimeloyl-ACP methyl ester carboxylesterase
MNILAHSFGPVLVALYAQTYPEHVGRMIFTGAIAPSRALSRQYVRATYESLDSAARARQAALIDSVETAADPVPFCLALEDRDSLPAPGTEGTMCSAPPDAIRYGMRYTRRITFGSLGDWDFTNSLDDVTAALLVIHGEHDPSGLESARAWAAAVPNGRVLIVPGAGHGPHGERPDLVFPAIDAFLSGRWPENAKEISE